MRPLARTLLATIWLAPAWALAQPPPEIPSPGEPTSGPVWVYIALTVFILLGAAAFFYTRRRAVAGRAGGQDVEAALDEARRAARALEAYDLPPDARDEADQLRIQLREVERRVAENPQIAGISGMLARVREIGARLDRLRTRNPPGSSTSAAA